MLRMEFKTFLNAMMRLPCQIVNTGRRTVYRLLGWNPWSSVFFRLVDRLKLSYGPRSRSPDAPVRRGSLPQKVHHPMLIRQLDTTFNRPGGQRLTLRQRQRQKLPTKPCRVRLFKD